MTVGISSSLKFNVRSHATSLADDGLDSALSKQGDREKAALVVQRKSGRKYDMAVAVVWS